MLKFTLLTQIFPLLCHQQRHRVAVAQAVHLHRPKVMQQKIHLRPRKHASIATLYQQRRLKRAQLADQF